MAADWKLKKDDHDVEATAAKKEFETNVRFDVCPKYFIIPNDLTPEEVKRCWWTVREIRASNKVCHWIARESRKLGYMTEIVDAVCQLTASNMICEEMQLIDSSPLETLAAARLVRSSSRSFATLRGLEHQVCDKLRQHARP